LESAGIKATSKILVKSTSGDAVAVAVVVVVMTYGVVTHEVLKS